MKNTKLLRLSRLCGKTVFYGCPDCLIELVDEAEGNRASACGICGVEKEATLFATGAVKMTCPIHAQSRGLLSRALSVLRGGVAHAGEQDRDDANPQFLDILTAQWIKDDTPKK